MATLPSLHPDADGTVTAMTAPTGSATYFDAVNDWQGGGTADEDTSYITAGLDSSGDVLLSLSNTPSDLSTMDTLTVVCRVRLNGTQTDDTTQLYAQVFDGNSTATPLTSEALVTDHTTGAAYTDDSTVLTIQGTPSKAQWDNAFLRLRWVFSKSMASDGIALRVTAARMDGTYTAVVATHATATPGVISAVTAVPAASTATGVGISAAPVTTAAVVTAPSTAVATSTGTATITSAATILGITVQITASTSPSMALMAVAIGSPSVLLDAEVAPATTANSTALPAMTISTTAGATATPVAIGLTVGLASTAAATGVSLTASLVALLAVLDAVAVAQGASRTPDFIPVAAVAHNATPPQAVFPALYTTVRMGAP